MFVAVLLTFFANQASAEKFQINIRESAGVGKASATFVCLESRFCEANFQSSSPNRLVKIGAVFQPGNADFQFMIDGTILSIGEQNYLHIAIGERFQKTQEVLLFEPDGKSKPNSSDTSLRFPVIRSPGRYLMTLVLDIQELE